LIAKDESIFLEIIKTKYTKKDIPPTWMMQKIYILLNGALLCSWCMVYGVLHSCNQFRHFYAGFHVPVGLQCAFDAPAKFGEHDVDVLCLPVFNVVLDLQHELLYGGEFGRVQLQFG